MKVLFLKITLLAEMILPVAGAALQTRAQAEDLRYPEMAPIEQYLMAPDAEVAMARSAAPESISLSAIMGGWTGRPGVLESTPARSHLFQSSRRAVQHSASSKEDGAGTSRQFENPVVRAD